MWITLSSISSLWKKVGAEVKEITNEENNQWDMLELEDGQTFIIGA